MLGLLFSCIGGASPPIRLVRSVWQRIQVRQLCGCARIGGDAIPTASIQVRD